MFGARIFSTGLVAVVLAAAFSTAADASPTMIRLGYTRCSACHLAPQGAGLLSDYGKGIDEAQSLRNAELEEPTGLRVIRYDWRTLVVGNSTEAAPSGARPAPPSWFRGYFRNSAAVGGRARAASTIYLEAPQGDASRLWTDKPIVDAQASFEFAPSQHVVFAVARERLPRGVELGETRTILEAGNDPDRFPTQLKAYFNHDRFQVITYAYAPGSESAVDRGARGFGALGEMQFFANHLSLGASVRRAESDTLDRDTVGLYARFGVGIWGVLAEHELTERTQSGLETAPRRYAGYTQFFIAPREWLVTSLIGEQSVDPGTAHPRSFRWRPEVQARLSSYITVTASARSDQVPSTGGTARMYLVQVSLKTVQ
jgi:hypothetical protein